MLEHPRYEPTDRSRTDEVATNRGGVATRPDEVAR
jgi:hypothetical protein